MTATIPSEFLPFVNSAVASGRFRSESELLAAALRLLEERERKLDALRADIQIGLDEIDRGDSIQLADATAQQFFFDSLKARGRERLSAQAKHDEPPAKE
jgi:antitoxin ParD1/3/4